MFTTTVYKAYDIRGTVPQQINDEFAYYLGRVLGQQALALQQSVYVVGHDNRLSSPTLAQALIRGMHDSGMNTLLIGEVPTPITYFSSYTMHDGNCVMITGSHNPQQYNGFKIMLAGQTLHGEDIRALQPAMERMQHTPIASTTGVAQADDHPVTAYLDYIQSHIQLHRPMRIAIDCGNAVAGTVAPELYRRLGCQVDALFCESDGTFPNHHPDPADPHNLEALKAHLQDSECELGLAFDGDADRLGVMTKCGTIIWPDRQLILFAQDILKRRAGATIIFDVKCSRHVPLSIEQAGGQPLMVRTGHSFIKAALQTHQAALAGEMSGHIFFNDGWFGFDDGLYAGARLLQILSAYDDPNTILMNLPQDISTPEIKLAVAEGQAHHIITQLQQASLFPSAQKINTLDGVRCEYADGFGLIRASNTTPVLVLRFEAQTNTALQAIIDEFKGALTQINPALAHALTEQLSPSLAGIAYNK